MDKNICEYIDSNRNAFINDLSRLVKINSVRTEKKPDMPFGEGCARVLKEASVILAEHGFNLINYGNFAGEISYGKNPSLMLLCHLDVVPAGEGWTKNPFELTTEGDLAYGRGTTDDKGAALACLYAIEAVKKLYPEPKNGVRLVFGCGEETGSEDMEYYFSQRPKLKYTLSPDADYPLINIEKGRYAPVYKKTIDSDGKNNVCELVGGGTHNIVPEQAYAVINGINEADIKNAVNDVKLKTGASFTYNTVSNGIKIVCKGLSAHAAVPQKGINAQTALIELILQIAPFDSVCINALSGLAKAFPHGQTDAKCCGLKISDADSGELTLNFGVLSYKNGLLTVGFDLRTPVSAKPDFVKNTLDKNLHNLGFSDGAKNIAIPPHCVSSDSELIKELLTVYKSYTGQQGKCLAIGGGTYVHSIDGGVAFGIEFPNKDYRIHGADEYCSVSELLLTAKMYAQVIKDLCL